MKRKIISGILAVMVILSLMLVCTSCAKKIPAMSYGKTEITANMYKYFACSYKSVFASTYSDFSDTPAFWQSVADGDMTAEEYLTETVLKNVKMTLVCAEKYDTFGGRLSSSVTKRIDDTISSYRNEYANGSSKVFNSVLAEYGVNERILREIYVLESKADALYEMLYGDGGTMSVSETQKNEYLNENYVHILHIYINDAYAYETDEDGYVKTDSNGYYITRKLTDEELSEKNTKISEIEQGIADGIEFEELYKNYSEDKNYDGGYYVYKGMPFIDEVVDTAFELEEGGWRKVKSDYGTHFVVRVPMGKAPYNDEANKDFFGNFEKNLKKKLFVEYVSGFIDDVTVYEDAIADIKLSEVPKNSIY